jgi:hypothetical protein
LNHRRSLRQIRTRKALEFVCLDVQAELQSIRSDYLILNGSSQSCCRSDVCGVQQ